MPLYLVPYFAARLWTLACIIEISTSKCTCAIDFCTCTLDRAIIHHLFLFSFYLSVRLFNSMCCAIYYKRILYLLFILLCA